MGVFQNNLMGAAAAAASAGGGDFYDYQIPKSVRMNKVSDANGGNFSKTFSGSPTSTKKGTFSTWLKRASAPGNETHAILVTGAGGGSSEQDIKFENNKLRLSGYSPSMDLTTTQLFRDTSAWYHIVVAWDTTQGTSTNRVKAYVNGEQITSFSTSTYPSQDQVIAWFSNTENRIGLQSWNDNNVYNGYMAETIGIDGTTYAASDFGETKNGVWVPKDASGLTFGNNGFYLNYASSGDLGNDVSGNNNDWTANNLAASDQTGDSPTFNSSSNGGNFATYNPLTAGSYISLSEGNLKTTGTQTGDEGCVLGTMGVTSGKWYWEVRMISMRYSVPGPGISAGSASATQATTTGGPRNLLYYAGNSSNFLRDFNSTIWGTVTEVETGLAGFSAGDKMMIALDVDNKKVWYGKNGSWFNSGNPATGANPQQAWTGTGFSINPSIQEYDSSSSSSSCANFGQDGTFAGTETAQGNSDDTGYGNFYYDPPAGFLAMCSGNLPVADAVDPAQTEDNIPQELFFMSDYNGNLTGRTITTENQPDLLMIRHWTTGQNWYTLDSTRVITDNKYILTNTTGAEATLPQSNITSVGATSVGISSGTWLNSTGATYQMWMWRANGGTTSTNDSGSTDSTVQVDPSGCFSIVKYTGQNDSWSNPATIGHGLSSAPSCILLKALGAADQWECFFSSVGNGGGSNPASNSLALNTTAALYTNQSYKTWGGTMPTSSVFTVDGNNANGTESEGIIAYCFADCEGFIKEGSYEGNGDADGTFVYTGFRPAFIMTKSIDSTSDWFVFDDLRAGYNVDNNAITMNEAAAQTTTDMIDILSNGFKMRIATDPNVAETYVYLAFAKNPFKYATAR